MGIKKPLVLNAGVLGEMASGDALQLAVLPRTTSVADTATGAVSVDTTDVYRITALAQACTFAAPTGTPVDSQLLEYCLADNGTARALAWNVIFASAGATLPTTTVAGKAMRLMMQYDSASAKWDCIGLAQEP